MKVEEKKGEAFFPVFIAIVEGKGGR